ncbi:SMU1112c/YaeR family gloxylase I-like metalloprotein [Clostridium pasteurianum]|uniref:Lactoylglutathione lyase-like lyase n=1 Tax=Clostridium pasteurianum BC1 TaxID=86416 RepID=R4KEM2_CLOPA|nr:VOC family protein [Clostridium pasteurianum]AGK98055.1 lactoylglutathione lyase-like lyase [Clostridium pasteurianum BC1]
MKFNRINHVAIICSDYYKSKKFYAEILGFAIIHETYRKERESYKLDLRVGDFDQIELFSFPNAPKRPSYPEACGLRHISFEVDNIENTVQYLKDKLIVVEPIRIDEFTNKKFTFLSDPDDLPIEIYEK